MPLARVIVTVPACLALASVAHAQKSPPKAASPSSDVSQMKQTVIPLNEMQFDLRPHLRKGPSFYPGIPAGIEPGPAVKPKLATAFCLDPDCLFVVTNYHVAAQMRLKKIKGQPVVERYLDTPPDGKATLNMSGDEPLPYDVGHDIAILKLREPLPGHHGLPFSCDELEPGERVEIWGYPLEGYDPFRKLLRFPATFRGKTYDGTLLFDYQPVNGKAIKGGASGGIVIDSETQNVVGILNRVITATGPQATAVPVEVLAEFVKTIDPFLAAKLFPANDVSSPLSDDLYPAYIPTHVDSFQKRKAEADAIKLLRTKAQALSDSIKNYVAIQTLAWGRGDHEPDAEAKFEIQELEGTQRYRRYPDGKKELEEPPYPRFPTSEWVSPSDEWLSLPEVVGTEMKLHVKQAPDIVADGKKMKVFQYYASVEDDVCPFKAVDDFIFFRIGKAVAVACHGEVWTDEQSNIVRISQELDLSQQLKAYRGWREYEIVLRYGWIKQGETTRLVPTTFLIQGRVKKHRDVFWCRGQFTDYREFGTKARLVAAQ